jgi:signal transduction histidine kinase/ligand-binding sensor domain-containing protein
MPKKRWLFAIILALLVHNFSSASSLPNTGFKVDRFPETDLPQGSVISLIQTRDGYLWMGTLAGLVRFDGTRYQVFDEANTPGLPSNEIVYLFEDSQTNLWVGTQSAGVILIRNGRLTTLDLGRGSNEGKLVSACEDSTGAVWLYTADGQLARYYNGKVTVITGREHSSMLRSVIMEPSGLLWLGIDRGQYGLNDKVVANSSALPIEKEMPATMLNLLLPSKQGGYWRLADGHVQKCRGNQVERDLGPYPWLTTSEQDPNQYTEFPKPLCAIEDQEGNLIVSVANKGIWWFDQDGKATQISAEQGLSHTTILSMCMDREGNLWLGTNGKGLNRVRKQTFSLVSGTEEKTVQSVCDDKHGGVWIGYPVDHIDHLQSNGITTYERTNALRSLEVRSVLLDSRQDLWAASWFCSWGPGLFKFQDTGFLPAPDYEMLNRDISALFEDHAGILWAGTEGGLARWDGKSWRVFTKQDGLTSERVRAIAETSAGELWIGTDGGGLYRLKDGKLTQAGKDQGLAEEKISSLLADGEVLWIGTRGRGLARYKDGKLTWYQRQQGLISNVISYLLDDGQGWLWMGSYGGLMRVWKKDLADFAAGKIKSVPCRAYGEADGLPSGECTAGSQPGACRTQDGRLWFPTTLGLGWVDPSRIKPNTNPPPVVIESVRVDGLSQSANGIRARLPNQITLKPGQQRVDIEFTSLNLTAPEKARVQYRMDMDGHENEWTDAGNSRTADYPKLPPGNYRFQVRAYNEDGVGNETGSSLAFIVEPPFWQTWWFITVATLSVVGLIVGIVHYVSTQKLQHQLAALKQQQALEKERQRIARDIHDQVGASLTQVSMLGEMVESDKDIPDEVEGHGRQIAQTARDTAKALDEIVWAVNPSNDTLDGLITYFCKYAQEYLSVASLRYRLDVPPNLPNTPLAPDLRHNIFLAAKEAVTNIVKHSKATAARIRLHLEPDRFVLEIEDNGKGMADMDPARAKTRNGLSNMRKRLEEVGGSFSIGPGMEGGTLVRLSAPLGNHKFDANRKAV